MVFRCLFGLFGLVVGVHSASWSYEGDTGPSHWGNLGFPLCNYTRQSPIDIDHSEATPFNDLLPFKFYGYDDRAEIMAYSNNGHTAVISIRENEDRRFSPYITNGGLPRFNNFEMASIHFHWGRHNEEGSEHTIEGEHYPLEGHIVHFNRRFGHNISHALYSANTYADSDDNSLAVLGIMFHIQEDHNPKLWPIIHALRKITEEDDYKEFDDRKHTFRFQDLLPRNVDKFYRYMGSLTTPPCYETVFWTVFKESVGISQTQLQAFRDLNMNGAAGSIPIGHNYRPVQNRNGRTVFYVDVEDKRECDNDGLWKHDDNIQWRESWEEYSFHGAVHHCIGADAKDGPFLGLMPIGKLRHFRNRYAFDDFFDSEHFKNRLCRARWFRVNAIKAPDGRWRQYPGGNEVLFHHYPEFDQERGDVGDTIVWDSHSDRLIIQDDEEDYHALCYREVEKCHHCWGYNIGHECNDAGDCTNRDCACDTQFNGTFCQIEPLAPYNIYDWENELLYDFEMGGYCRVNALNHDFPDDDDEGDASAFVFGDVHMCEYDGDEDCYYFNRLNQTWVRFDAPPVGDRNIENFDYEVIRVDGKDRFWMFAGGHDISSGPTHEPYKHTWIMRETRQWERGPDLPYAVHDHCLVQISDCEIAIIGGDMGSENSFSNGEFDSDDYTNRIVIYNFETKEWREGPRLNDERAYHKCARVRDPYTHNMNVVIACGHNDNGGEDSYGNESDNVEAWDLVTDYVRVLNSSGSFGCPSGGYNNDLLTRQLIGSGHQIERFAVADELSEHQAFFGYGTYHYDSSEETHSSDFYVFDLEYGFRRLNDDFDGNVDHSRTEEWSGYTSVVPAFYFDCKKSSGGP